jgi:hypothetical protein
MEFKTYGEIDLNQTPIAVLGCGHFFTGETLDGLVGMSSVYTTDNLGNYNGLRQVAEEFAAVPACPDCRVPIRQFATRRYNRVVNKAVLDETSKRFLVNGRHRLEELEERVTDVEAGLANSRDTEKLKSDRYKAATNLDKEVVRLRRDMKAEHQPTKKLFDAVQTFQRLDRERAMRELEQRLHNLNLLQPNASPAKVSLAPQQLVYDQQITLGAHRLHLRVQEAILRDAFTLASSKRADNLVLSALLGGRQLDRLSTLFLHQCQDLIAKASEAKLPRLVIPTCLGYARIAQLDGWYRRTVLTNRATTSPNGHGDEPKNRTKQGKGEDRTKTARQLLTDALALCDGFPGGADYRSEVEETMRLFEGARYEEVTPAEIAAIKAAMVSGPGGIATHSGHWYRCPNGHPVSLSSSFHL